MARIFKYNISQEIISRHVFLRERHDDILENKDIFSQSKIYHSLNFSLS